MAEQFGWEEGGRIETIQEVVVIEQLLRAINAVNEHFSDKAEVIKTEVFAFHVFQRGAESPGDL